MCPEASREMLKVSTVSPYDAVISHRFLYSPKGASLKKIAERIVRSDKKTPYLIFCRYWRLETCQNRGIQWGEHI